MSKKNSIEVLWYEKRETLGRTPWIVFRKEGILHINVLGGYPTEPKYAKRMAASLQTPEHTFVAHYPHLRNYIFKLDPPSEEAKQEMEAEYALLCL